MAYLQYKKTAIELIKNNPTNVIVIMRTSCARVQSWLHPVKDQFPNPKVLEFVHNLESYTDILIELDSLFRSKPMD